MLRFAPSPTDNLSVESLRTAIVNYLVAKRRNDGFLVRIDDSDKTRVVEGKDTEIMQILEKFALRHDRVYHQSEHLHIHQSLAVRLLEEKKAFICTCDTSESDVCSGGCETKSEAEYAEIKASGTPFVVRLKKPDTPIEVKDIVLGAINGTPEEIGDIVILRADATPTYDFACACEDMLGDIDTVIRSDAYAAHTPKQRYVLSQLGVEHTCTYAHLPRLRNKQEEPLEEDENAAYVIDLFKRGFIPDAIANYLILLTYPDAPEAIFTIPDAIAWFELENVPPTLARFDIERLREINREHLKRLDDKALSQVFGFADASIGKLAKLYLDEASTIEELQEHIRPIFSPKPLDDPTWGEAMRTLQALVLEAPMMAPYDTFVAYLSRRSGLEGESLFIPLRLLLTGAKNGPELRDIYTHIKPYLLEVVS